jgi:hypothetical protein
MIDFQFQILQSEAPSAFARPRQDKHVRSCDMQTVSFQNGTLVLNRDIQFRFGVNPAGQNKIYLN